MRKMTVASAPPHCLQQNTDRLTGHHGGRSIASPNRTVTTKTATLIRLLLIDGHEIARIGLRALLNQAEHIEIVGEAGTVSSAVEEARRLRPDVVLIELQLPDGRGVDVFPRIREVSPDTRLLVLTHSADDESIILSLQSGAVGFLLKTVTRPRLVQAIETVSAGQSILDPAVSSLVMAHIRNQSVSRYQKMPGMLSPQEHHIMKLVIQGKITKAIASALGLSDKTVKNNLSRIYEKLQVSGRAQATSVFLQQNQ